MTIVATLMAGVVDMGYYCMDERGDVYRFDPRGQKAIGLPMSERVARRVRKAIAARTAMTSQNSPVATENIAAEP